MSAQPASEPATEAVVVVEDVQTLAIVPFGRGRAKAKSTAQSQVCALRQKYLAEHKGKSTEECLEAMRARLVASEAQLREAKEPQALRVAYIQEARRELVKEREKVAKAIEEEVEAAKAYKEAGAKQAATARRTEDQRLRLLEAQKQVAMLEVVKRNVVQMEKLQEQRVAAVRAAQEAKRSMLEQKSSERRAIEEATKQVTEQFHQQAGAKRKTVEGEFPPPEVEGPAATATAAGGAAREKEEEEGRAAVVGSPPQKRAREASPPSAEAEPEGGGVAAAAREETSGTAAAAQEEASVAAAVAEEETSVATVQEKEEPPEQQKQEIGEPLAADGLSVSEVALCAAGA